MTARPITTGSFGSKDKLGTRSMASGEIKLEGAIAYAVGRLDRGFVQMAEMVNSSRLSNGVKSTALMRRAHHDAMTVAKNRVVFGSRIIDLPLARRQLMKIMLATEQALSMSFLTADALDRGEAGSQDAAALLRILTPTLKFRATRDARKVCGDALEMRGGIGYIEEFATARLLRDAHLGSIWEGTGNIVALDALKRAVGRHGAEAALAADLHARLDDSANVPQAWRARLRDLTDRAIGFAREVASRMDNEADARRATSLLYHVASAVALAWEGGRIHEMRGDARRLLLSRLVIDHRVLGGRSVPAHGKSGAARDHRPPARRARRRHGRGWRIACGGVGSAFRAREARFSPLPWERSDRTLRIRVRGYGSSMTVTPHPNPLRCGRGAHFPT